MLPGSTPERASREAAKGKQSGRTQEIQRLIGRSLRTVTRLDLLADFLITVDCDVLQADGGTRTRQSVGLRGPARRDHPTRPSRHRQGARAQRPGRGGVGGIIDGVTMLDLPYEEDSRAETDMNVVMTGAGHFVEVQGTAELAAFTRTELDSLLDSRARASPTSTPPASAPRHGPAVRVA